MLKVAWGDLAKWVGEGFVSGSEAIDSQTHCAAPGLCSVGGCSSRIPAGQELPGLRFGCGSVQLLGQLSFRMAHFDFY